MKARFVLDAWAILALLQREEPAASRVKQLLEEASRGDIELSISIINLGEIVYRIGKERGENEALETLDQLRRLPMRVLPATDEAVFAAVGFKMHYPISYADAFAAAAAEALGATLVSGDPDLVQLEGKLAIEKLERSV
jgi:predicted nucleic acid-binding protein